MKNVMEPVTRFDLDEALEIQDEKSRGYRDQILTGLDKVVKELESIREENIIGNHRVDKKLTNHERRISKLEGQTPQ